MKYLLGLMFALIGTTAFSQTVTPIIQSCAINKKQVCVGEFSIRNDGITPLFVTTEKKSFSLDASGGVHLRDLDPSVNLELSESSARISPKSFHNFGYRISCGRYPCSVIIFSSMIVGRNKNGMEVRISLPETAYVCESGKPQDCRSAVRRAAGIPEGNTARVAAQVK